MEERYIINLIKKLFQRSTSTADPVIIPRDQHIISRQNISSNALKVLSRLHHAGYQAFLVGGSVRDLLLGIKPKDFDIATDARPEEVKHIFHNCRLIGQRFRLAHVHFGGEIIEVATFRAAHSKGSDEHGQTRNGMIIRDNVYGTLREDAWRRDFRINALYYNIADFSVVDYTGGMQDIANRQVQIIGDAVTRYKEDPVRMLRAIRFANKLNLKIHPKTAEPFAKNSHLLAQIAPSRLFDEILKMLLTGHAVKNFRDLQNYKFLRQLFPLTHECLTTDDNHFFEKFILLALENTDARVHQGKSVTPAFILAVLLWQPAQNIAAKLRKEKVHPIPAMEKALEQVFNKQNQYISIPRRLLHIIRAIWILQPAFLRRYGSRPERLMGQTNFRAAYDFLQLRAQAGEAVDEVAQWWQQFTVADHEQQQKLIASVDRRPAKKPVS